MANGPKTAAAIHKYLRERTSLSWAPTTARTASWVLLDFARNSPPLLRSVKRKHVARWLTQPRSGRALADSTQRTRLSTLRAFCDWAVEQRMLPSNPARGIVLRTERQRRPRAVPAGSTGSIVKVCSTSRQRAIVLVTLHLGLRRAEVVGLQLHDIDWDRRVVFVRGKGGYEDSMPVPEEAWRAMGDYIAEWPASSGPLFRSFTTGRGLSPAWVGRLVSTTLRDAGIKVRAYDGMSMHSLRHRMILDVLEETKDPQRTRQVSRHRSWPGFQQYTDVTLGVEEMRSTLGERRYAS